MGPYRPRDRPTNFFCSNTLLVGLEMVRDAFQASSTSFGPESAPKMKFWGKIPTRRGAPRGVAVEKINLYKKCHIVPQSIQASVYTLYPLPPMKILGGL